MEEATSNGKTPHGKYRRFSRLDVGKLLTEPPPPVDWIVEGLLAKQSATLLAGREGAMKSYLALALCGGIQDGCDVANFSCHQGRILYIDAENGENEIRRRLHKFGLSSEIEIWLPEGADLERDFDELLGIVEETQPDLVIFDSVRALYPKVEENDSRHAESVTARWRNEIARPFDCAICAIFHAPKNGVYRGSTGWGAGVEIVASVVKNADERRSLTVSKCRPGAIAPKRGFIIREEGTMQHLEACEPPEIQDNEHDNGRQEPPPKYIELKPKGLAAHIPGEVLPLKDLCIALGLTPKNRTGRKIRDSLIEDGSIREVDGGTILADSLPTGVGCPVSGVPLTGGYTEDTETPLDATATQSPYQPLGDFA